MSEPGDKNAPDTPGDECAALQWAIESFRNNAHSLKDPAFAKKWLAYSKQLLLMKGVVETIQRGDAPAIVAPESSLELHRIDHDELVGLIAQAREGGEAHEYLLAISAALIDNDHSLPGPLKEFVIEFLRKPELPRRGAGRQRNCRRDNFIAWTVAIISIRWKFSPTRNEATEGASAISIVKRALQEVEIDLTEGAITKIWDKSGAWKEQAARWKKSVRID